LIFVVENSTPSNFHPIVPHNESIFADQNFGYTYKDITKQVNLLQPIWNLTVKIVVVYWLHFQKPKFNVYFLWQD
jgi:hypothetical protein